MVSRSQTLTLLLCFVANEVASAQATTPRPNYTEWQADQANISATEKAALAKQAKMAAVNKVISMLTDLRAQVLAEGETEAATYNKFACFCKDTTAEKVDAIKTGTTEKSDLEADILRLSGVRDGLDTDIKNLLDDINVAEKAVAKAKRIRAKELKLYQFNDADLQAALAALVGAISSLKSSKQPSFVQLQEVQKTVRTAVLLADALGLEGAKALQTPFAPPTEDYKFHSDKIIATLEKLETDFRDKKTEVDKEEVKSVQAHDIFLQTKHDYIKQKNVELEEKKEERARTITDIEQNSEELTTTAAVLLDDQEYLKELAEMCSQKAQTWDQRTKVRRDEIFTLTQVVQVMEGAVSEKTTAATIRFSQVGTSVKLAQVVARDQGSMEAMEAEAESEESFLQVQSSPRAISFLARKSPRTDGRKKIADLLRNSGKDLKSTLLSALASKIASSEDPFAKIKILIQELLERLLSEQGHEANQKGWCDKAQKDAIQKRGYAADEIRELNSNMAEFEATRNKLQEELQVLLDEVNELKAARAEAVKIRAEEKAENANTVAEAQAGMEALDMGIDIISKFYKTVAKEEVVYSLAQGPADDAPEQSFKVGEAYKGAQSESGGILGMMEVMKSDFERTISETEEAEAQAEQDHIQFMTETGKSLAEKKEAMTLKLRQKSDVSYKLDQAQDNLDAQTVIMVTAIKELMELKPVCVDTGMSYADRAANRQAEIAALKKADCILSAYIQYGPDGAADAC